jgi:hypothetical protein
MKAAGIAPTEEVFGNIRDELTRAIGSRRIRAKDGEPRK